MQVGEYDESPVERKSCVSTRQVISLLGPFQAGPAVQALNRLGPVVPNVGAIPA